MRRTDEQLLSSPLHTSTTPSPHPSAGHSGLWFLGNPIHSTSGRGWGWMAVTRDQAHMLAALAVACRPTGAPHWDPPGVVAAISKIVGLHLADVTIAVIRAASDPTLKTPAPIGVTASPCWADRVVGPAHPHPERLDRADRCRICGKSQHDCVRSLSSEHTFEPDWVPNPEQRAHVDIAQVRRELAGGGS